MSVILLIPSTINTQFMLDKYYINPIKDSVPLIFHPFEYEVNTTGKVTAKLAKDFLLSNLHRFKELNARYIYVTNAEYFKQLTKQKAADSLGIPTPCIIDGYKELTVFYGINYQTVMYDDRNLEKLERSITAISKHYLGVDEVKLPKVHKIAHKDYAEIKKFLNSIINETHLSIDVETFGLRHEEAGIGTIAFTLPNEYTVSFPVDGNNGRQFKDFVVRNYLKTFFEHYEGKTIYHNASFDIKIMTFVLFANEGYNIEDTIYGIEVLTKNFEDTKIMAYLCTNSCAGNELSLKVLAQEYTGRWSLGDDIKDITKVPLSTLLNYNGIDTLATNYLYNKYKDMLVTEGQLEIYETLLKPSVIPLIQTELAGMPMDLDKIDEAEVALNEIIDASEAIIQNHPSTAKALWILKEKRAEDDNKKLVKLVRKPEDFKDMKFNSNSGNQLIVLLHEVMGLPILDLTKTKLPATGNDTLEKLINHTDNQENKDLISAIIDKGAASKITSSFITAFRNTITHGADNKLYLHGNFNIGGTVSGRLSSSNPNLQTIPSSSTHAAIIKQCFSPPKGWLMVGPDFNSLEDMVSALTTKDKNKLKVYIDGFDGHSLRAANYFREQLLHIDLNDPASVNSIAEDYPELRQDSKDPTFLLTYRGTYHGMMKNLGWSKEKSQAVEANYHELYAESDAWVQKRLDQATIDGYVTGAFGLKVRTPLMKNNIGTGRSILAATSAESRTAGNALGQSYCLLNNRAFNAFMAKVWKSKHRTSILPIALIHDAIYLLVKDDIEVLEWVNTNLIQEMRWQELPELKHDLVKIGAELDVFYPTWNNPIKLKNDLTQTEIKAALKAEMEKRNA